MPPPCQAQVCRTPSVSLTSFLGVSKQSYLLLVAEFLQRRLSDSAPWLSLSNATVLHAVYVSSAIGSTFLQNYSLKNSNKVVQKLPLTCSNFVEQAIRQQFTAFRPLGPPDDRVCIVEWEIADWLMDSKTTKLLSADDPWIISNVMTFRRDGCSFCNFFFKIRFQMPSQQYIWWNKWTDFWIDSVTILDIEKQKFKCVGKLFDH